MRDGILSDESVMKMCAEFQPIPLGQVSSILNVKQIESKLPTKSKYPAQPPARPAFFGAMSNSMAKQMDPTNTAPMRNDINQQYVDELRLANTNPMPPSQPEQGSPFTPQAYEAFSPSVNPLAVQESFQQRGTPGASQQTETDVAFASPAPISQVQGSSSMSREERLANRTIRRFGTSSPVPFLAPSNTPMEGIGSRFPRIMAGMSPMNILPSIPRRTRIAPES